MVNGPKMKFKVVTPERIIFQDSVNFAVIESKMGQITVYPHHISMVSLLKSGEILIQRDDKKIPLVISGGILEVSRNETVVLADTAEHVHELDLERAQKAVELAKNLLKEKKYDVQQYEQLRQRLQKHEARVNCFRKWR